MTTIAYRDGIMAADSAVFADDVLPGVNVKIRRLQDGSLYAGSGRSIAIALVAQHLGAAGPKPTQDSDDAVGLLISSEGKFFSVNGHDDVAEIQGRFCAAGSGRQIALGAMAAGATAERAVEIACELDAYSRGPVQVERLVRR